MSGRFSDPNPANESSTARVNEHVTMINFDNSQPTKVKPKKQWLTTSAPATFDKVAVVSAMLGLLIGMGCVIFLFVPSVGTYMVAMGVFHLLEFVITARYNPSSLGMCSFLLTNGLGYAGAQLLTVIEYLARWHYRGYASSPRWTVLTSSILALIVGQCIRSAAMIHAAQSFNHFVQERKKDDHCLVTSGVYSLVRHPSYFGYYIWMVASQVALGNIVCLAAFIVVINYYFVQRLKTEEAALVNFFGKDYIEYREKTWSGIPFSP